MNLKFLPTTQCVRQRIQLETAFTDFYREHKRLREQSRSRSKDNERREHEQEKIVIALVNSGGQITSVMAKQPSRVTATNNVASTKKAAVQKRMRLVPHHYADEEDDEDDDAEGVDQPPPPASTKGRLLLLLLLLPVGIPGRYLPIISTPLQSFPCIWSPTHVSSVNGFGS